MKVKIVSSQKTTFWYADKIGQEFYVTDHNYRNYKVVPNGHYIRIYDCEVISHSDMGISYCDIPKSALKIVSRLIDITSK